jgi:hypothetical protein
MLSTKYCEQHEFFPVKTIGLDCDLSKLGFFLCLSMAERGERNIFWLVMCLAYRSAVLEHFNKRYC